MLLTNRNIKSKEDIIKVVRLYFSRWKIEEYFRAKKQEFGFENIRLRTLKEIKNILSYAREEIREWKKIEKREKYMQLELKL